MNIYLIRHAQSEWQLNQLAGRDSVITNIGIIQAHYLNIYIREVMDVNTDSSVIYVSPLRRAVQTVNSLGRNYILDSRIMEAQFHVASSLPQFDQPHIYERKLSEETKYNEFKLNIRKTLESLILLKYNNIYLYTHGGVIKTILRIIHDNDSICYKINNCSITKIIWKRARWHMDCVNYVSFLPKKYIT